MYGDYVVLNVNLDLLFWGANLALMAVGYFQQLYLFNIASKICKFYHLGPAIPGLFLRYDREFVINATAMTKFH